MRLLHVVSDVPTNRVITEDFKYIRWFDEPFRKTGMDSIPVKRIRVGTVMPKSWIRQIMKLYQTHSNAAVKMNNLYRISILELGIVRWSDEALRHTHTKVTDWDYSPIPKGTAMPDFWSVKQR